MPPKQAGDTKPSPLWRWILTSIVAQEEIWPLLEDKRSLHRTSRAARRHLDVRVQWLRVHFYPGALVGAARRLRSVRQLELCCEDAEAAVPALPALRRLTALLAGDNGCLLGIARHPTALRRLRRLHVTGHRLPDDTCAALIRAAAGLPQLRALDLSGNHPGNDCRDRRGRLGKAQGARVAWACCRPSMFHCRQCGSTRAGDRAERALVPPGCAGAACDTPPAEQPS